MSIDEALQPRLANLMKFPREDGELDVEAFARGGRHGFLATGDRGRQLLVSDARDRAETPRVPPAGARLREPRCSADGAWLPYDSDEGRAYAGGYHRVDDGARIASRPRSRAEGPFAATSRTAAAMIGVMAQHRAAVGTIQTPT